MARPKTTAFIHVMLLVCIVLAVSLVPSVAQTQANLGVDQVVDRMQRHEADQSRELKHYEAIRHYEVQYKGFGSLIAAKMDVDINFDSPSGKSFRIVSQSGSKLLCDKVLKRAVD
ncbi:MAG: hypothetical protein WA354_14945, partial [Terracidiphilus sp.]